MSLNAYSKFLEQNLMERLYDKFLAKHKALKIGKTSQVILKTISKIRYKNGDLLMICA